MCKSVIRRHLIQRQNIFRVSNTFWLFSLHFWASLLHSRTWAKASLPNIKSSKAPPEQNSNIIWKGKFNHSLLIVNFHYILNLQMYEESPCTATVDNSKQLYDYDLLWISGMTVTVSFSVSCKSFGNVEGLYSVGPTHYTLNKGKLVHQAGVYRCFCSVKHDIGSRLCGYSS